MTEMRPLFLFYLCIIIFISSCKNEIESRPDPVIIGRQGDTCQISKVSFMNEREVLDYAYINKKVASITLKAQGNSYLCNLSYDSNNRLQKVSGLLMDTNYEYDQKGRLIKENRILHYDILRGQGHYQSRIFEYNDLDQLIKCSYVEARDSGLNTQFVKQGEVYLYESYHFNIQGDIERMESFYRDWPSSKYIKTNEYTFSYDKLISPFYGNPGILDYGLYFGAETGNNVMVFSKHNLTQMKTNGYINNITYEYSLTNYPLSGKNVLWQNVFVPIMSFEYINCK